MDYRKLQQKLYEIDSTTPQQDLERITALAESSVGIDMGATKETLNESVEVVSEKAVSKAQQKLMGQAYALKKGDMKAKDASKEVKKLAKDMSKSDLKDFASTKHKGKPEHVKKESVAEAEQVLKAEKGDGKMPSKKQILLMCSKGMSVKEMCEAHPDCDQKKLKEMCQMCLKEYKMKKNESVELVDEFGEIVEAKKSAAQKKAQEKFKAMVKGKKADDKDSMDESSAKPDFLDMDKDGDKKEPMKKAIKDKKKGAVKESITESATPLNFVQMIKLVKESGGQQAIDPMDTALWNWANRVASSKITEGGQKAEIFAAMIYERNGGRFEMYDVLAEDSK